MHINAKLMVSLCKEAIHTQKKKTKNNQKANQHNSYSGIILNVHVFILEQGFPF